MFGISGSEFLIIIAVGLIVIGPKKLPGIAKTAGRMFGEFKKATGDLKENIAADENLVQVKRHFDDAVAEGMKQGQKAMEEVAVNEEAWTGDHLDYSGTLYEEEPEEEVEQKAGAQDESEAQTKSQKET